MVAVHTEGAGAALAPSAPESWMGPITAMITVTVQFTSAWVERPSRALIGPATSSFNQARQRGQLIPDAVQSRRAASAASRLHWGVTGQPGQHMLSGEGMGRADSRVMAAANITSHKPIESGRAQQTAPIPPPAAHAMAAPAAFRWIKTDCGRAKYLDLVQRPGLPARLRLAWFVLVAALRDWPLPPR